MAVIRFHVNHLKVSSGRGASRVVQYLIRDGQYAPKQEQVAYLTRTSQATAERDDLVHQEVANLPAWAHRDAAAFFARAEQHERVNGRWGTTWQLALPKELSRDAQVTMARDFLQAHLADKPHLWVVHDPVNAEGAHQPHVHVLFSTRANDGLDRGGPAQHFKRYNPTHPERGGCQKDPWFLQRSSVEELRFAWCDWTNYTLERAGHEARVHPSSLYTRGIDRQPEPKVGPGHDAALMAERARIRQARDAAREHAQASQAWQARKVKLGITNVHQIPPQQFVQSTMHRARNVQPGQWVPGMPSPQAQQQARVAQQQAQRAQAVQRLGTEIRLLERRRTTIHVPRVQRQPLEPIRTGLRANLREEPEHERGRAQGW